MVEPDRLTPGTSASDWARPIVTPSLVAMCSMPLVRLPDRSAQSRTRPPTISVDGDEPQVAGTGLDLVLERQAEDGDRDRWRR